MKKNKKDNVLSVRLNQKDYDQLVKLSTDNDISIAEAVRYSINTSYMLTLSEEQKQVEQDNVIEAVFKRIDLMEKKNMLLEALIYKQEKELKKSIKEIDLMEKEYLKQYRNQLTITESKVLNKY